MRAFRLLVVISTVALTVAIAVSCRSQEAPQQAEASGPAAVGSMRDVIGSRNVAVWARLDGNPGSCGRGDGVRTDRPPGGAVGVWIV